MYKAPTLEELYSNNKHKIDMNHKSIKNWIWQQEKDFKRSLFKSHGYNRVVSLYAFDQLVQLEKCQANNNVCVVSGSTQELETKFITYQDIFATSFENGFDLTENWEKGDSHKSDILNSFDLVMCNQVLEHVPEPLESFKNLVALTKPGGYIWVSIPVINRIHDEPNFYSSGYHPRFLKFLGDQCGLETVHVDAWGSLKYKLFAVSRNWPPLRKLEPGLRSNSDFMFPQQMFTNGAINDNKHLVDAWALYKKV